MQRLRSYLLLAPLILSCGPVVGIPGGSLSGTVRPVPADWAFSDEVSTIQIETNPGDPYSVNVWCIGIGPRLYVAGSRSGSTWVDNLRTDPRARVRMGSDLYELTAIETEDEKERNAYVEALVAKYEWELDAEQQADATLFRLEPR